MNRTYVDTARLLANVAPYILDDTLALKGGTAINLFVRDMPRLSVDLDLTFLDHTVQRADALASIDMSLERAARRLERAGYEVRLPGETNVLEQKLYVTRNRVTVKAEVNRVIRGTVEPARTMSLAPRAREALGLDVELQLVSDDDLYGGKLVAALDRQHPRDLYDVAQLFEDGGITRGICRAFVIYLASHNRPMHEVLFPREQDITEVYESSFVGMTAEEVGLRELLEARARLMYELPRALTANQRQFLISLANAEPAWDLLDVPHARELPAIRWRLQNLEKLSLDNHDKLESQREELVARFEQ